MFCNFEAKFKIKFLTEYLKKTSHEKKTACTTFTVICDYGFSPVLHGVQAHLNTVNVSVGQKITQGGIIGAAGCSGNAARITVTEYHIHIEANSTNSWSNPRDIDVLDLLTTKITRP